MTDWVLWGRYDKHRATELHDLIAPLLEATGTASSIAEIDEDESVWELSIYSDGEGISEVDARIQEAFGEIGLARKELPRTDWVALSLEGLAPVRAGRFVVHGSHDRHAARSHHILIEIEAGLAFGTGHHATTKGCLLAIQRIMNCRRPRRMLDLGTGSGVLAIALAKLVREPVLATDIDAVATRVAKANASANGVAPLVRTATAKGMAHPDIQSGAPFDLVVANILAEPLRAMAGDIARSVAHGGTIILSGLLDRQRRAVLAAYRRYGFAERSALHIGGWATLTLERPTPATRYFRTIRPSRAMPERSKPERASVSSSRARRKPAA